MSIRSCRSASSRWTSIVVRVVEVVRIGIRSSIQSRWFVSTVKPPTSDAAAIMAVHRVCLAVSSSRILMARITSVMYVGSEKEA